MSLRKVQNSIFIFLIGVFSSESFANVALKPCESEESIITTQSAPEPKLPEQIKRPRKIKPLGCERPFVLKGQTYSVDSPQQQDAAQLREAVADTAESVSTLNDYNRNRKLSKISAYTGTFGLLTFALANLVAGQFVQPTRDSVRSAMTVGGLALATGGFLYSFTLLRTNEFLIPKAVDQYNANHPNDPIELRFEAGWSF